MFCVCCGGSGSELRNGGFGVWEFGIEGLRFRTPLSYKFA